MNNIDRNHKNKILFAFLMLYMAVCLAGCGNDSSDSSGSGDSGAGSGSSGSKAYVSGINPADYVTLGEYKGIEVTETYPTVSDEDVDSYIENVRSNHGEQLEVTDRTIQEGDTVSIDYAGYKDGVAFDGGTGSIDDLVIGSGRFIPGFEDGLIGAGIGEQLSLDLTFPANYTNEELAGAAVVFEVTVNGIWETEPAEYNDAFVQELGIEGVSTTEEYDSYVYDMLYEQRMASYQEAIEIDVITTVMANCSFEEPPEEMVERYYNTVQQQMTLQAASFGADLDTFMSVFYGMDQTSYALAFRQQAARYAHQYIMYQAIADAEGLNPGEEELAQAKEESMAQSGAATMEEFNELLDEEAFREYVVGTKVIQFLLDNSLVTTSIVD